MAEGKKLALRQPPDCTGVGGSIANVIACFNYLVLVGHSTCPAVSGQGGAVVCKAGDAQVVNSFSHSFNDPGPGTLSAW